MTTAYTPILKLALPVTGELNGTWGDVVNNNITSMVEQAVAGLATINTWTANSHTLTTADGTTSESRCAMLVIDDDGAGNPSAAATVICPTATKAYIVQNLCGQTVTVKTAAGTGVAVPNNQSALVFCNGTNVVTGAFNGDVVGPASATDNAIVRYDGATGKLIQNSGVTIDDSNNVSGVVQLNATTVDTTNIEVTNLKAKDGTTAGSIADSTGIVTLGSSVLTTTDINGGTVDGTTIGATTPSTVVATQVDITAQGDLRLQDTTGGQYVALQAPGTIATSYTLTLPVDDGTSGQALITDGSGVLSWSTAASGDVYGPASATDNAVARYDGTTGKIIQNSAVTIGDDGATVIAANSSSDGLRITQTGTGNALLVEDSANPDATPFVVSSVGQVFVGSTQAYATTVGGTNYNPTMQMHAASANTPSIGYEVANWATTTGAGSFSFAKSRGGVIGTHAVVSPGDSVGDTYYFGSDGTNFIEAARITAAVDGTPGTNDMPGRLVFSTTADGASAPTERMRINSSGNVSIGGTGNAQTNLYLLKNITGAATAYSLRLGNEIQSDVTTSAFVIRTDISTQAASFALTNLRHYFANQGAIGAGSSVGNQYGFVAESSLTGATNNYGFYGNIAAGTGRWNFYAAGTADNYFGGATTISVNSTSDALKITQVGTGNALLVEDSANPDATPTVIGSDGDIVVGSTTAQTFPSGDGVNRTASLQTQGSSFAKTTIAAALYNTAASVGGAALSLSKSNSATIGSHAVVASGDVLGVVSFNGSDGTNFVRAASIVAQVDGTPGTNDMPGRLVFSTTADGASSPTERMRIDNAGNVGIGTTAQAFEKLVLAGTFPSGSANTRANVVRGTIPSSTTGLFNGFRTEPTTQAASFTLTAMTHFSANQGTLGAGSAVTNQYGFIAESSLTGATNNYGFLGNIASGTGRWNFYAAGTADNYFAGAVGVGTTGSSGNFKVDILPATSGSALRVRGDASNSSVIQFTDNIASVEWGTVVTTAASIGLSHTSTIRFSTTGVERGRVSSTGAWSLGATAGAESLRVTPVASAVNYYNITGGVTTGSPYLAAQGSDANIHSQYLSKGTFGHIFNTGSAGNFQFYIAHTASAVNYLQVTGGTTGGSPYIISTGSDTNVGLNLTTKGASNIGFSTNNFGSSAFVIAHTASAVNYLQVTGGTTGNAATLSAQGSDTNIDLALTPKGTGRVRFGTLTANADAPITGYIEVKDSAGNVRKLAVIA